MAYILNPLELPPLDGLPMELRSVNDDNLSLVVVEQKHHDALWRIFNDIIQEGLFYPQDHVHTLEEWQAYFLSYDCFCVVDKNDTVMGGFYIKPNFPGRSSVCDNASFISFYIVVFFSFYVLS